MKKTVILFLSSLLMSAMYAQSTATAAWWATTPAYARYAHQLRLIDSLRQFCTDELKLNVGNSFYNTWISGGDSMFVYLYASRPDTIALPDMVKSMVWAFDKEDSAIATSNKLKSRGYHTLVYKTAGTSGALLNHKLLSYPDEAIAFIVFHEAVHKHVGQMVDYNYVEALCDAVGTRASLKFAEKTGRLSMAKVLAHQRILEGLYKFLNAKRIDLGKSKGDRQMIYDTCNTQIKLLTADANQFIKDRMSYPVNNAYFIRVQPYAIHYFEMYDGLGDSIDIAKATTGLPGAKPENEEKELKLPSDNKGPLYDWGK